MNFKEMLAFISLSLLGDFERFSGKYIQFFPLAMCNLFIYFKSNECITHEIWEILQCSVEIRTR
jgi:hypothetical protein